MFLALRLGPALSVVAAVAAETRAATSQLEATPRQLYLAWLVTTCPRLSLASLF